MSLTIVTHGDLDGWAAGYIARRALDTTWLKPCSVVYANHDNVDAIIAFEMSHGADNIMVLDITPSEKTLDKLDGHRVYAKRSVWLIDHHKSAMELTTKYDWGKYYDGMCAAKAIIAWSGEMFDWLSMGMFSMFDKRMKQHYDAQHRTWDMGEFVKYHSRFMARRDGVIASPLCLADKYGVALYPTWLWVALVWLTGEGREYTNDKKYLVDGAAYYNNPSLWKHFTRYRGLVRGWVSGEIPLEPWRNTDADNVL